jgi:hypothetical protein
MPLDLFLKFCAFLSKMNIESLLHLQIFGLGLKQLKNMNHLFIDIVLIVILTWLCGQ